MFSRYFIECEISSKIKRYKFQNQMKMNQTNQFKEKQIKKEKSDVARETKMV